VAEELLPVVGIQHAFGSVDEVIREPDEPEVEVHIVTDNSARHKTPSAIALAAHEPRVHLRTPVRTGTVGQRRRHRIHAQDILIRPRRRPSGPPWVGGVKHRRAFGAPRERAGCVTLVFSPAGLAAILPRSERTNDAD